MATKTLVAWIFAALKTHLTLSYFILNFDFFLKLQAIPEIKKCPKHFTQGFKGENLF